MFPIVAVVVGVGAAGVAAYRYLHAKSKRRRIHRDWEELKALEHHVYPEDDR